MKQNIVIGSDHAGFDLKDFFKTYLSNEGFNVNDVMIWRKLNIMPVIKQPRYNPCFEYIILVE